MATGLIQLLGSASTAVANYFTRRAEIKAQDRQQERALKQALVERQIELIKEGLHADASWELEQIKNSGWKDEYVLIVLSIPLTMCFVPGLDGYVLRGFKVLSQTPDWYQWLVVIIFAAIYGIRLYRRQLSDT
jgi:hypothetical protein